MRVSKKVVALAAGLLAVPVALGVTYAVGNVPKTTTKASGSVHPVGPTSDKVPCPGTKIKLTDVSTKSQAPVLLPDTTLANRNNVSAVWLCGTAVRIIFDSGVAIQVDPNEYSDPRAHFEKFAAENPTGRSMGTVRGQAALFTDGSFFPGSKAGGAEWSEGDWHYFLLGQGRASLDQIKEMAASLHSYP